MSITINSAPLQNRVLLNANTTVVSITSSNGIGYYFRAFIYVDDVLFDEQGWSRKDNFTAEKDLKNLYNSYYEKIFNSTFSNGLTEQTHLTKKISIVIKEKELATDYVSQSIGLPDFYFMYNAKPIQFNDTTKVQFLGISPSVMQISSTGKIAIPFFVDATAEDVTVVLKNNFNTTLITNIQPNVTGKKIFLYHFNLAGITLALNTIYFELSITVGSTTITKNIRLLVYPDYTVKEIAFANNFGFYQYAYLDGALAIDNSLDIKSYVQADLTEKIYEINEEQSYAINSGSLVDSEKELLDDITNSFDSKIYFNGEWVDMISKTKKVSQFKDRQNNYSENLIFNVKKNTNVESIGMGISTAILISRINFISVTAVDECLTFTFELDAGYEPSAVTVFCVRADTSTSDDTGSPISPRTICGFTTPGEYTFYLREIETYELSNPITITL